MIQIDYPCAFAIGFIFGYNKSSFTASVGIATSIIAPIVASLYTTMPRFETMEWLGYPVNPWICAGLVILVPIFASLGWLANKLMRWLNDQS